MISREFTEYVDIDVTVIDVNNEVIYCDSHIGVILPIE